MIDWGNLIQERNVWVAHNFPFNHPDRPKPIETVMGVFEEVGELVHCELKAGQKIRGTEDEHTANSKDAIGDATVYLLGVMSFFNIKPDDGYQPPYSQRPENADRALGELGAAVGRLYGVITGDARHRNPEREIATHLNRRRVSHIVYLMRRFCEFREWDYDACVEETWAKVKQRDWIEDPTTGGDLDAPQNPVEDYSSVDLDAALKHDYPEGD